MSEKKPLTRTVKKLIGQHSDLWGDCTGLRGDCSNIPKSSRPCNINDWVEEVPE
jgi:hypothetical protein